MRSRSGALVCADEASATARRATSCSGTLARARQLLDGVAVAVARREVHSRVSARRILAKNLLDLADPLEEERPVDRRQQPHRRDDVADGELAGGLALMLDAEHLFGGIVLRFECALQGMPRRRGRGWLIAEPVEQLDDEGGREPAARCRFVAQHLVDDVFRLAVAGRELHAPRARPVPAAARRDHFSGQSAQLFDQPEPQHDRDRPDLSDGQRRRALIRGGEVDERLEIETAGCVCDQFARERVDAWISGERTVRELWQLEVVLSRKVLANFADLVLNDVMVIAQPVFRADCRRVLGDGPGQESIRIVELLRGIVQARQQRLASSGRVGRDSIQLGECQGMTFELVLAKELRRRMRLFVRQGIGWVSQRR